MEVRDYILFNVDPDINFSVRKIFVDIEIY